MPVSPKNADTIDVPIYKFVIKPMQDDPVNPQKPHFFNFKSATAHTRLKMLPNINTPKDQSGIFGRLLFIAFELVKYTKAVPELIISINTRYAVKHPWRFFSLELSSLDIMKKILELLTRMASLNHLAMGNLV